jgi:Bacterial membrane protein YfhO
MSTREVQFYPSRRKINWRALLDLEGVRAALVLALILNIIFLPAIWGGKTLLDSAWHASSVMPGGAYHTGPQPPHFSPTPDAGAPAWQNEPWLKIISNQFWKEHSLPLWDPYAAYGKPFIAAQLPQPFYPLTAPVALYPTPWTYNLLVVGRLFLAGLFTYFFARLFVAHAASLFSAISFMLTGYFIVYLAMPHLSVEVLLPAVFLAFELLLRKNSWSAVAAASTVIFLCVAGGMPESLFLVISFGFVYSLFRLIFGAEFRQQQLLRLGRLLLALVLGFTLSAFLLLPFLEFMRNGFDTHQPHLHRDYIAGVITNSDWRGAIIYLLPSLFGSSAGWNVYWGILPVLFAVVAVRGLFSDRRADSSSITPLTFFFAISLLLMLLKRFGSPLINWVGQLPIVNMVLFPKYQEPLLAFCVAILGGIGFSIFLKSRSLGYFFAAALTITVLLFALIDALRPLILAYAAGTFIVYRTLMAVGILIICAVLFGISTYYSRASWPSLAFIGLLSAELFFSYIFPSYYLYNSLPSAADYNPYSGAPYLDFLRQRNAGRYRVFARQNVLHPNWSGAFDLMDVRDLDGMYYRRYINFIRNFLLRPGDEERVNGELADRFTGWGDGYLYNLDTSQEQRFLTLSSVKYVISVSELGVDTRVINEIINQHRAEKLWGFGPEYFPVSAGKTAFGLFQHPPSRRVSFKTIIDPAQPVLEGVASIQADAQDKTDGVGFLVELESGDKIKPLFSTLLNPKDVAQDRAGRPFRIDLSSYAGQDIKLLFSTDPGPSADKAFDWAGWAKLRFVPNDPKLTMAPLFDEIYDNEVRIYEFSRTLPRANLFYAAEILPDGEILNRLKDPAFKPEQQVLLSAESLPQADTAMLKTFTTASSATTANATARIVSYDSQRVEIETQSNAPALLMLNDANYPGWRAFVNGKPAPIMQADYLFRGVTVPAGRASVEFRYAPDSIRVGALISLASLIVLVAPLFRRRVESTGVWHSEAKREPGSIPVGESVTHLLPVEQAAVDQSLVVSPQGNRRMSRLDDLDMVIRRRNGKILANIPQLGLYGKGENVEAALAALDAKKKELAAELEETGELDILEIDNRPATPRRGVTASTSDDLGRFAIKTGIVALFIGAALTISAAIVGLEIEQAINNVKSVKIGGAQFWTRMEAELDRLASPVNDLPEVKKQKLLADIRAIALKWHPFVAEIRSALASPDSPPQGPPLMNDK